MFSEDFIKSHHYSCNPNPNVSNNVQLFIEEVCYCRQTVLKTNQPNNYNRPFILETQML